MRLRLMILTWFLIACSMTGIANAATPTIQHADMLAAQVSNAETVALPASFSLLPPPPPPPPLSCAQTCRDRYTHCLFVGINPGVCAAKYNACLVLRCTGSPVLSM